MRRLGLVLGIVAGLLPLTARAAWAQCECDPGLSTPRGQAVAASVVFTGKVTSITTPSVDDVAVRFQVETLYKGAVGNTVAVTTPDQRGACHFDFVLPVRYTVFADRNLTSTSCSGNVRGVINPTGYGLRVIRGVTEHSAPARGAPPWVWGVIALALVVTGAASYGVTRRRVRSQPD